MYHIQLQVLQEIECLCGGLLALGYRPSDYCHYNYHNCSRATTAFPGGMASSTLFSEIEQYKFNTTFSNNGSTYQHAIPADPETATTRFEIWKRVKLLARGAFGTVWLEAEEKGQQLRAVKRIAKTNNALHLRELLTLTELKVYPKHFVQFFGWFESEEDMYFAMEYIKHGDLSKLINRNSTPIPESDVKSISRQILDGLKVMHDNDFCHRDLKPENILVVSPSPIIVKICDFGVSKRLQEGTNFRTTVGTLGYVAPEVTDLFEGDSSVYTCAADIWSLGCLIYALLTKETPFPAMRKLISYVEGLIPFPESKLVESKASQDAIAFIINLMIPEPEARLTARAALNEPWLKEEFETMGGKGRISGRARKKPPHRCADIHCAARHGNIGTVRLFTERRGSNIKVKNKQGRTPLHSAAAAGHVNLVKYLLKEGADINATGRFGETPLHCAASAGCTDVVGVLVDQGADIMSRKKDGQTPLHSAAASGHCAVLNLLLEAGADICATDKDGLTALGEATYLGRKNMAKMLLVKAEGDFTSVRDGYCRGKIVGRLRPSRDKEPPLGVVPPVSLQKEIKLRGKVIYRNSWIHGAKGLDTSPWQALMPYFSGSGYIHHGKTSVMGKGLMFVITAITRRAKVAMGHMSDPGDEHKQCHNHGGGSYLMIPAPPIV